MLEALSSYNADADAWETGIIVETGSGVTLLKKGDRIVLPFNVADGRCRNCEEGKTAFCTGVNPGFAGGA
jgi:threonine dehydrogenase-like Zn-dependent dehydrogenase